MAADSLADGIGSSDHQKLQELIETASRLVAKGKGLLASDESVGTIGKRIEKAGLANTEVTCAASSTRLQLSWLQGPKPDLTCRKTGAVTEKAFTPLR